MRIGSDKQIGLSDGCLRSSIDDVDFQGSNLELLSDSLELVGDSLELRGSNLEI
jgi:hypothetical protein